MTGLARQLDLYFWVLSRDGTWIQHIIFYFLNPQVSSLTSLDQLIFKLEILFSFFKKQATLRRRSTVLSLPLS